MAIPSPSEVCTVTIDGFNYQTWDAVVVSLRLMEGYNIFEVSVTEEVPGPKSIAALRFSTGDQVQVTLGGVNALSGMITERQSASDAERHSVQLIGKGWPWKMIKSSIAPPLGNFDGQTLVQIVSQIIAQTGVGGVVIGAVDSTPFDKLQAAPGQPAWDFIENIARYRSTILGSDVPGNFVLIGPHASPVIDTLLEGDGGNIERINVVISNDFLFETYFAVGQSTGSDQSWGVNAAQIAASMRGPDPWSSNLVIPTEEPNSSGELQRRLLFEWQIHNGTQVNATVVVPTWFRPNGALWLPGDTYNVIAPDHFPGYPNGFAMSVRAATFQQNNETGTTTTLEMVLPWLLNGTLFQPNLPPTWQGPLPANVTPISPPPPQQQQPPP